MAGSVLGAHDRLAGRNPTLTVQTSLTLDPAPAPAREAPVRIQVRRVLLLARLLTVFSMILGAAVYVVGEAIEWSNHIELPLDQTLLDLRLWAMVFVFWAAVMTGARRALRLHE